MSLVKKLVKKAEKAINSGLRMVGGQNSEGDGRWWVHLMYDAKPGLGGRASFRGILHTPMKAQPHFELAIRKLRANAAIGLGVKGGEAEIDGRIGLGPVALYVGIENLWGLFGKVSYLKALKYGDRNIEIYIHDDREDRGVFDPHVHWRLWTSSMEWSSKTPKWREGGVFPMQLIFGDCKVWDEKVLKEKETVIPMPEGPYKAKAVLTEYWFGFCHLKRFWRHGKRVKLDFDPPIPHSRKGSLWGISMSANSIEEAVGKVVGDCMTYVNLSHLEPHPDVQREQLKERQRRGHHSNLRRGEKWAIVTEIKEQLQIEVTPKEIAGSDYREDQNAVYVTLTTGSILNLFGVAPPADEDERSQDEYFRTRRNGGNEVSAKEA